MAIGWRRAAAIAVLVFLALFAFRFFSLRQEMATDGSIVDANFQANEPFEIGRKNYASLKKQLSSTPSSPYIADAGPASPDTQKYEKIGNLAQSTRDYEVDRKKIDGLITDNKGIVQYERATGLPGGRSLQLGIGVPPANFDAFIEAARSVGKGLSIEIVKNDKTTEYLQMRAKRDTLTKARTALEDLKAGGGAIDERVNVQTRLTEIEQQIQDLGVSLGEFDSENELCTVKVSLREVRPLRPASVLRHAYHAFKDALFDYALLGLGFFAISAGLWFAGAVFGMVRTMTAGSTSSPFPPKQS